MLSFYPLQFLFASVWPILPLKTLLLVATPEQMLRQSWLHSSILSPFLFPCKLLLLLPLLICMPCKCLPLLKRNVFGLLQVQPTPTVFGWDLMANLVFQNIFSLIFSKLTHELDHVSKGGMLNALTAHCFTKGLNSYAQKYSQSYVVCATHNAGDTISCSIIPKL